MPNMENSNIITETIDELTEKLILEQLKSFGSDFFNDESKDENLLWICFVKNPNVKSAIQKFFNDRQSFDDFNNRKIVILAAISSLQLFVVDNFLCRFNKDQFPELKQLVDFLDKVLPKDGLANVSKLVPMFNNVGYVRLLEFARCCFTHENLDGFPVLESLIWKIWSIRSIVVYQKTLQEYESAFHQRMIGDSRDIQNLLAQLSVSNEVQLSIFCEIVNSFLTYKDVDKAKFFLSEAKTFSRFDFELAGCLGIRTYYQQKEVSQLTVTLQEKVHIDKSQNAENKITPRRKGILPPNEKLEDDTLLSEVKFLNPIKPENIHVSEIEQCLFITTFKYRFLFSHSDDALLHEELSALISFILEKSNVWAILFVLLNHRSLIDRNSRRRVERSMKQMESLANILRQSENCSRKTFVEQTLFRLEYFYTVASSPIWMIEKNLADILYSLGLIKSSLEIYIILQSWDQIIDCYRRINQPDKAENIIRDMIQKGNNLPYWYCLLGEVTGNIEYYQKSRELSDKLYSRASKMLGLHYFGLKDYSTALKYLEESVKINYLQTDCWYRIGYISLESEDWSLAAKAYRNVLQFDSDSFEAWNNLSKAYIKLGDKERALRTLQEAIKCNYDEWKLWDNFIAVALDVKSFNDCLIAFNRLLDLNKNYMDDKIISGIAYVVFENLNDNEGRPARQFLPKILELFARISAIGDPTHSFWRHYAHILIFNQEKDTTKITQCLQKSHRKLINNKGWESDPNRIENLSKHCIEIYDDFQNVYQIDQSRKNSLNACKLLLNSALTQITRAHQNLDNNRVDEIVMQNIVENMKNIQQKIAKITEQIGG